MLKLRKIRYRLHFKFDAGTSRGVMRERDVLFVIVYDEARPRIFGIGEVAPLPGLSMDTLEKVEEKAQFLENQGIPVPQHEQGIEDWVCATVGTDLPSLRFGLEMAIRDYLHGGRRLIFESGFVHGRQLLPINGLVWMGDRQFMLEQIKRKLADGFTCLKIKIGALDLEAEIDLIRYVRSRFSSDVLELRLDANGAFGPDEALDVLARLARYDIHSIEQPIGKGQRKAMAELCRVAPVPVALDEELIGVISSEERSAVLEEVKPAYIVLKPTLVGGFVASSDWIHHCNNHHVGWWITSALESNVGLNAIAQFVSQYNTNMPQGLGTGQLYTNNIAAPLVLSGEKLGYDPSRSWDLSRISP